MKLKTTLNLCLIAAFILFNKSFSFGQNDELWQSDFDKGVEWTQHSPEAGILLVGTGDWILHGIDDKSGNLLWSSDELKSSKAVKGPDGKKMDFSSTHIEVLQDDGKKEISDYIQIKFDDAVGGKNFAIVNQKTGETVISPEKAEMPMSKFFGKELPTFNYNGSAYLPELTAAIIQGNWIDYNQKGNPEVFITKLVDLPSGKVRWTSTEVATDFLPVVANDGNLIFAGKKTIAKLNAKDGSVIWRFDTEDKKQTFEAFDTDISYKTGYFFEKRKNNGFMTAMDLSTGKRLWSKELKLKEVPTLKAIKSGVMVVDSKEFEFYELSNGEIKWKIKKVTGDIVDLGDKGIAIVAKDKYLRLIDHKTGAEKWEEKIKGIDIDQITGAGIMYTDAKGRLGVITYNGEKIWDKKGMLEKPALRLRTGLEREIMYIDGSMYNVDLMKADYTVMDSKIKFEGDEEASALEYVQDGILLSSSQNLILYDESGKKVYQKYFEAPGLSLAAKIALRAAQVAMVAMAAQSQAQASYEKNMNNGFSTYRTDRLESQAESFANAANALGSEAKKKFSASKSKGNYHVLVTRVGQGGQSKSAGLAKVNKNNGEVEGTILLGDKKPIYDYDPVSGQVFFKADKKKVISYAF